MSVSRSGEDEFYGNLEWQTVRVGALIGTGTGNSNDSQATAASIEPVGPAELANDEVAELVYFRRLLDMEINVAGDTDNQEATEHNVKGEMGVNLDPGSGTNEQFATSDQNFGVNGISFNSDRTHLDVAAIGTGSIPQNVAGGSAAGGFGVNAMERDINYRNHFGMGPFLDADDSLDFRVEAGQRNSNAGVFADYYVTFAWDISTVEGARPTLSPPGGMGR
jgi:hypothetical protein